jgi:KUP system potassium uptake protein
MTARARRPRGARRRLATLSLAALGVVFGDIGTSPLYAVRECFHGPHHVPPAPANVMGVLSLVFWSLVVVVSVKYLVFILRCDNHGEGGIFALMALLPGGGGKDVGERTALSALAPGILIAGLCGAALLYGDGVITPAISVLSAVEGLSLVTRAAEPFVVPITVAILLALFVAQSHGTGRIGKVFGPIMAAWFACIAVFGVMGIAHDPGVLLALHPAHAVRFLAENGLRGVEVLGSVVLCITGGEALYADLGHFGPPPIRWGWFAVVLPALLLSYFGQGAILLARPELAPNPFFGLVPGPLLVPMVVLATAATVIASQALISGCFSLTREAVQLGFWPRVTITHTSGEREGQIYVPVVNRAMLVGCVALVLWFRSSSALGGAYGLAVTAVMGITSVLYYLVVTRAWGWSPWKVAPLVGLFLLFDVGYFGANLLKFLHGGWVPVVIAACIVLAMMTWWDGRAAVSARLRTSAFPVDVLLDDIEVAQVHRVPGTAVFMSQSIEGAPPALLHHLKHAKVLHDKVVLLAIESARVPLVASDEQLVLEPLREGFYRLRARYGFMETPDVPDILARARRLGLDADPVKTSFFLSRESLRTTGKTSMWRWRKELFTLIARNARPATDYFGLPPGRVIELGIQIEI